MSKKTKTHLLAELPTAPVTEPINYTVYVPSEGSTDKLTYVGWGNSICPFDTLSEALEFIDEQEKLHAVSQSDPQKIITDDLSDNDKDLVMESLITEKPKNLKGRKLKDALYSQLEHEKSLSTKTRKVA